MKSHSNVSRHYKLEISNHPLQSALNILFLKVEACFQPLKIKVKTIHFKVENIRFPFLQAPMQRTRIIEAGSTTNQSEYSSSCTVIGLSHHGLLYKWTELLYLTCPHEADLLTLIMSQKLIQYL